MRTSDSIENVIDSERREILDWKELLRYRELFYFFTWRDIKVKYKQTVLGFLWAILQPVLMMVIFTFFFGRTLQVPSQQLPYPVFVFSGLLLWSLFSSGLTNAANSMVTNAPIIKKIYFPRLIIPVSSVMVAVFDFAMAFVMLAPLLIYYRQPVSLSAFWLWPLSLAISIVSSLGPGCLLAALNVKYRDFRYVIPFMVQVLFFLTPVIYPPTMLSYPFLQYVMALSPMYAAIELFRYPLTGVDPNLSLIMISVASGFFLLLAGMIYFRKTEDFFADFA